MRTPRVAIFASGNGSNAMALIKKAMDLGTDKIQVGFVLSDKANAPVLAKAAEQGVKTLLIEKSQDRYHHEQQILKALCEYRIDWILLAGYMKLLSSDFIHQFATFHGAHSQIVNIHPSLLPEYPGKDSIQRAFNDGVEKSGVTLHFVDEGMDTGNVITQISLPLSKTETLEAWSQKIHNIEHEMYANFLESLTNNERTTYFFEEKK